MEVARDQYQRKQIRTVYPSWNYHPGKYLPENKRKQTAYIYVEKLGCSQQSRESVL